MRFYAFVFIKNEDKEILAADVVYLQVNGGNDSRILPAQAWGPRGVILGEAANTCAPWVAHSASKTYQSCCKGSHACRVD